MRFSCLKNNLEPVLQTLSRVVSSRPTLPVLNNILIKAQDKQVSLSATNLDIGIVSNIGAKVDAEGVFTVPAKLLTEFVSSIPHDKIEFALEGNILHVSSENYQASLHGIDADEFPENPALKGEEKALLSAVDLLNNIPLVTFAAAADEARPVITGVLMLLDGKDMTMVAADGYRLAEKKVALHEDSGKSGNKLIIPARSLNELQRIIAGAEEGAVVEMAFDENQVVFQYQETQLVSRLLVGQYPDYKQIIPPKFATQAILDREALHKAVRIAALFAKDSASVIHLNFSAGQLEIKAASSQIGENSTVLPADIQGDGGNISYNARYLLDFLNVVSTPRVRLRINDPLGPGVSGIEEDDSYTYVIMPIRT
jgi:DNA polymerase-3 subunit beta